MEQKIEELEEKKSQYEKALCDPETHRDSARVKNISLELKQITVELENAYNTWTALNSKLENISVCQN